jgi:hypothetical protein
MTAQRRRLQIATYAVLTALVLAPILSVHVPCLGDYLNHLARIHILLTIGQSAALQGYYDSHWHLMPYLGMDVPVAAAVPVLGIYGAGRLFIATCVLMPVIAAACLQYALYRRVGFVPVIAFLLCYNFDLALGFVTYLFSVCLAIVVFAGWIAAVAWPRWRRALVFSLLSTGLFLSHSFAFPVYGMLVFGWEVSRLRPWRGWRATLAALALAGVQAVPPVVLAYALQVGGTYGREKQTLYGSLGDRIAALLSPLYFPGPGGLLPAALCGLVLAAVFVGRPRWPKPVWLPLLLTALAALTVPHVLLNVWGTDLRIPLVLAILAIGSAMPPPGMTRRAGHVVVIGVIVLVGVRAVTAGRLLTGLDAQVSAMRRVVAALPPGRRLLIVDAPQDASGRLAPRGVIQQMGMVAAIDRDAFIPSLFVGTSPLWLLPAMAPSASQGDKYPDFAQLAEGYARPAPPGVLPAAGIGGQMYWLGWPRKFDYVLVMNFGGAVPALPPVLHDVSGDQVARLYRVVLP